ncbi:DUF1761 domain-containing protein [Thalassotalea euphylliae]|uniref:DUF1761 domain-containing protein n=1 Tax=Thalassotalea euphylliae TaxID=1655234 RepID=UPI0036412F55
MEALNFLAIFVAAITSFILGGLWYSPVLFGQAWVEESGFDESQAEHPTQVFGLSFLFALISAFGFALLLGPEPTLLFAIHHALLVGFALVATSFAINYQFSHKSLKLLLIDGGYHLGQFLLYGLVLGLWH